MRQCGRIRGLDPAPGAVGDSGGPSVLSDLRASPMFHESLGRHHYQE
jgi:hypothetical protein